MSAATIDADDTAYVTALVREDNRPRYYATLFAPASIRDDLFALYGFAGEIARVPDLVREAGLGEIRLKWWGDALTEAVVGEEGRAETPSLRAVSRAIVRHALPIAPFHALVEARSPDLYSDPPATVTDLEARLGETESVLFQMAAIISGSAGPETADAAGHAGVAYGVARRLARFGSERTRMRSVLSTDLLAGEGLSASSIFTEPPHAGLSKVVNALTQHARVHLDKAQGRVGSLPRELRAPFLPLAIVAPLLGRVERAGVDILSRDVGVSDLEALLRIALARLR